MCFSCCNILQLHPFKWYRTGCVDPRDTLAAPRGFLRGSVVPYKNRSPESRYQDDNPAMSQIFIGMEPLMGASNEMWKQRRPRFSQRKERVLKRQERICSRDAENDMFSVKSTKIHCHCQPWRDSTTRLQLQYHVLYFPRTCCFLISLFKKKSWNTDAKVDFYQSINWLKLNSPLFLLLVINTLMVKILKGDLLLLSAFYDCTWNIFGVLTAGDTNGGQRCHTGLQDSMMGSFPMLSDTA